MNRIVLRATRHRGWGSVLRRFCVKLQYKFIDAIEGFTRTISRRGIDGNDVAISFMELVEAIFWPIVTMSIKLVDHCMCCGKSIYLRVMPKRVRSTNYWILNTPCTGLVHKNRCKHYDHRSKKCIKAIPMVFQSEAGNRCVLDASEGGVDKDRATILSNMIAWIVRLLDGGGFVMGGYSRDVLNAAMVIQTRAGSGIYCGEYKSPTQSFVFNKKKRMGAEIVPDRDDVSGLKDAKRVIDAMLCNG